jgi:putative thioredoxin
MSDIISSPSPYILEANDLDFDHRGSGTRCWGRHLSLLVPKTGPCLRLYPVVEQLTLEANGKFLLVNVNIERSRSAAALFGVTSVPTLKLIKAGQVVETIHGFQPEPEIRRKLRRLAQAVMGNLITRFQTELSRFAH